MEFKIVEISEEKFLMKYMRLFLNFQEFCQMLSLYKSHGHATKNLLMSQTVSSCLFCSLDQQINLQLLCATNLFYFKKPFFWPFRQAVFAVILQDTETFAKIGKKSILKAFKLKVYVLLLCSYRSITKRC